MKTILFDLDGTLLDSSPGIRHCFIKTFKELGLPVPNDQTIQSFIGPPLETTFKTINPNPEFIQRAIQTYRRYYQETGVYEATIYEGIVQALEELVRSGYQLFITTSKNQEMATLMMKHFKLDNYFTAIYGSTPTAFIKADVIKRVINDYHLTLHETCIIGDTKFDIIGGKTIGIKTIAVTWGFGQSKDLAQANAVIKQPSDIKKAFETI